MSVEAKETIEAMKIRLVKAEEMLPEIHLLRSGPGGMAPMEVVEGVKGIIEEVRMRGDAALIHFTRRFDGVDLSSRELRVEEREIEDAREEVSDDQIEAMRFLKKRIENFERRILEGMDFSYRDGHIKVGMTLRPLGSVGCYTPGGTAAYPSSLFMALVPAKLARVPRTVVCSPPSRRGQVHPSILVAASMCGVDEIYKVGGAQAIAAMAYGTESIPPVEKIVGPGNIFVDTAKRLVSSDVAIDMPAGPSEVLVLADRTAEPWFVALDLISQAEHGEYSVCGLVTDSKSFAQDVLGVLRRIVVSVPNSERVVEALSNRGFIAVAESMEEAVGFVNAFAPEHLEIMTEDPWEAAERIESAGILLVGPYTPVSASDYCIGTNHILPTGGGAHIYSALSVLDFVKRMSIVQCSRSGLEYFSGTVRTLADAEGLPNHYRALEGRLRV